MMVKEGCNALTWPARAALRAELYAAHAACEGRGLLSAVSWCAELLAGLPCEVPSTHRQPTGQRGLWSHVRHCLRLNAQLPVVLNLLALRQSTPSGSAPQTTTIEVARGGVEVRQVKLARSYMKVGEYLRAAHLLQKSVQALSVCGTTLTLRLPC
jgi:hypothetical protein